MITNNPAFSRSKTPMPLLFEVNLPLFSASPEYQHQSPNSSQSRKVRAQAANNVSLTMPMKSPSWSSRNWFMHIGLSRPDLQEGLRYAYQDPRQMFYVLPSRTWWRKPHVPLWATGTWMSDNPQWGRTGWLCSGFMRDRAFADALKGNTNWLNAPRAQILLRLLVRVPGIPHLWLYGMVEKLVAALLVTTNSLRGRIWNNQNVEARS